MLKRVDACVEGVAPFSPIATEALAILSRPDVDAGAATEMLGKDQTLAARVLRLANSPFYGCTGRIATLREAFLVLGTRTLYQTVMAAAVMSALDSDSPASLRRWRHTMRAAHAARLLAAGRTDPDVASTAGLLHDLGRIVLDSCLRPEDHRMLEQARQAGQSVDAAERSTFGVDHAQVGARVAQRWRLPAVLVDALGRHHRPDDGEPSVLVDVVHLADVLAHALDPEARDELVPIASEQAWRRSGMDELRIEVLFDALAKEDAA